MKKTIKFPINIAKALGGYALELEIGSLKKSVHLLIDTGSSTIAFSSSNYSPDDDGSVSYSAYAQCVTYGKGGWTGPVLHTEINYTNGTNTFEIDNAPFALVENSQTQSFLGLDGIIGLAYHHLNQAHDLAKNNTDTSQADYKTFPWTFTDKVNTEGFTGKIKRDR